MVIFVKSIAGKFCVVFLTVILLFMLLFDLFYCQTFTFYGEEFKTNYLVNTDVKQYQNKLFKKVIIKYKDIKKIEERTNGKHKQIYLYTHNDELISIDVEYHFEEIYAQIKNNISE